MLYCSQVTCVVSPTLTSPSPSKPFEFETNTNDHAIGYIIYQDGKSISFEN